MVAFVSQMFAYRWAQNFRHNVLLQEKNAKLLGELTKKKELAEKATRAKSRFLASVSHDLRQPLHAINLYLAVLKRSLDKTQTQTTNTNEALAASSLDHLQDSATQLTRMFEALIDISKLDAGTTQANLSPIQIGPMVNQLSQEYSQHASQRSLIFDKKPPSQIDTMEVFADAIMLERVLRNLLTNAISHTHKGGVRLRVRLVNRHGRDFLEFRVVDTGPGIQHAECTRIFEEFYQSETTRENTQQTYNTVKNLGLGLAISSRLAELLKTEIRLHSYIGKGSAFSFELPMQFTPVASTQFQQPNEASGAIARCLGQACIAVIDDDPNILDATSQLLESYGAIVFTTEDSTQTWQVIHDLGKVPDIFLVDHRLAKESGLTLIKTIHEKFGPSKPCILITGDTSADQVASFHQAGVRVLYKPLTDEALIEAIGQSLGAIELG